MSDVKTRRSKRDVPIPLSLKNILLLHQATQRSEQAQALNAWQNTDAVFATQAGDYTHPDNLNRALENLCNWSGPGKVLDKHFIGVPVKVRAKLQAIIKAGDALPNLTPHDLRHTAATLMLKRKTPVEVVSRILGHARVSITMDVYRHVLESEKEQHMPDLFDAPLPVRDIPLPSLN